MGDSHDTFEAFEEEFLIEFEEAKLDAEKFGAGILLVSKNGEVIHKTFGQMLDFMIEQLQTTKSLN